MPGIMTAGVSLRSIPNEEFHYTFLLASGITEASIGLAVSLDTGAANTVKLAGNGEVVIGRLETYEDRTVEGIKVGTVSMKGALVLPWSGTLSPAFVVGSRIVGAGSGFIRPLVAADVASLAVVPPFQLVVELQAAPVRLATVLML